MNEFKKWLKDQIARLQSYPSKERLPEDHIHARWAYSKAVTLGLPEAAAACRKGPVMVSLLECLQALPEAELLTLPEAAEYLGYQPAGLRKLIEQEQITYFQNGKGPIKFKREWLDQFIADNSSSGLDRSPARAYRKIEPKFGFDPSLLD